MANQELFAFIQKWLSEGGNPEKLKSELMAADWEEGEVDEALSSLGIKSDKSEKTTAENEPAKRHEFEKTSSNSHAPTEINSPQEKVGSDDNPKTPEQPQPPSSIPTIEKSMVSSKQPEQEKRLEESEEPVPEERRRRAEELADKTPGLTAFRGPGKHSGEGVQPEKSAQKQYATPPRQQEQQEKQKSETPKPTPPLQQTASAQEPKKPESAPAAPTPPEQESGTVAEPVDKAIPKSKKTAAVISTPAIKLPGQREHQKGAKVATPEIDRENSVGFPGIVELFSLAWERYSSRFVALITIALIPALASAAFGITTTLLAHLASPEAPWWYFGTFAVAAFLLIIQGWGQLALLSALNGAAASANFAKAYAGTWRKILSYWWISIIAGLITLGGFFLFVIPGILFAVWFSFSLFVLVAEGERGMSALLKSREYVRGHWWGVAARFLAISLFAGVISALATAAAQYAPLPFIEELVVGVVSLLIVPFVLSYGFCLYESLRSQASLTTFSPTLGKKAAYLGAGLLGIILVPGVLLAVAILTLDDARATLSEQQEQQAP